jgi:hypothetical protein
MNIVLYRSFFFVLHEFIVTTLLYFLITILFLFTILIWHILLLRKNGNEERATEASKAELNEDST